MCYWNEWRCLQSRRCIIVGCCYVPYHRSNSISVSTRDALQTHSWSPNITSRTLPFFRPDNSRLGPSPPAPYHKQNHHYPILQYFTCQRALSHTCILFGISDYGYTRSRYHMIQSISPHVYSFHHMLVSYYHAVLIFDIPFSMCSLLYYQPLCFSFYYLNIGYLSCHSQFRIST